MREPRNDLADCSPSTHEIASAMFRLSASVGADDRGNALAVELQFGAVTERLESQDLQPFQLSKAYSFVRGHF